MEIDDQEVWHQVALSETCEKAANDEVQVRALAKALAMEPTNGFIRGRLHRSLAKES